MWHPAARQTLIRSHSLTHSLAYPTQVSRPSTPTIDVYAASCTFADTDQLAVDLATTVMTIAQVPTIPMFRKNTAAFVHELPASALANVDGDSTYVRVQVLTNAGALDRDRTWVLLTEAPEGGWGLHGVAHMNAELVMAARVEIAALQAAAAERDPQN